MASQDSFVSSEAQAVDLWAKVRQYEVLLNETLKPDLRRVLEQRDALYNKISEHQQLISTIQAVKKNGSEPLTTKVDLGCNFYCNAKVADTSSVNVNIGCGIYLSMGLDEALTFLNQRSNHLDGKSKYLTDKIAKIKATTKLVLEALRELQGLSATAKPNDLNSF